MAVYCGHHEAITALLRGAGGQRKIADGATVHGGRLELYRNETGLWTMVITFPDTLPDRSTCIIATGDSWSERSPPEPEKPAQES